MCGAGAVVVAASKTPLSRASIARATRTARESPARAKPLATTRRVFVRSREVLFGSRTCDDVTRSQRGEKKKKLHRAGAAIVALGFEAPTSNFAREVCSRLKTGRGRRRRSRWSRRAIGAPFRRRRKRIIIAAYFTHDKLAH